MKIVVAMDSFKGSLTAEAACRAVERGLRSVHPLAEIVCKPMADGGEGTAKALLACRDGIWIPGEVTGPLPDQRVSAGYAWFPDDQTAVVEMASAAGLTRVPQGQLNPMKTTTYGVGELILAACRQGAKKMLLTVGGSATVDGGIGAAAAMGWNFLDAGGREVPPCGGSLSRIETIVEPEGEQRPPVEVLCDVDNPLTGPSGAAAAYGPQKGATPDMVIALDAGLKHLAELVRRQYGLEIDDRSGAGASGGLAAGAVAFMGARLVSGIEAVMKAARLEVGLEGADWVLTGEGRFDEQSLRGKVVSGVARAARQQGARVGVLAGSVQLDATRYRSIGIDRACAITPPDETLASSLANAEHNLTTTTENMALTL